MANYVNRALSLLRVKKSEKQISGAAKKGITDISFGPSSLNLMMADSCNSQCIMCGKDYQACGSHEYISLENMKTIYQHLDTDQLVDVIYGGGGEPFLNPELADIAEHTHSQYPVIQHTVISNFIQWKPEMVSSLLESNVHFLISVNAASANTFKEVSGVDAFAAVTEHLKSLVQMRGKQKNPVRISMSMILMRRNIKELCDFVQLAADIGVDEVKTLYVRVYPEQYREKENRDRLITPGDSLVFDQELSDRIIREAEDLARENKIEFDHEPLFSCSQKKERNCCEPWKSLFINFNGDVYPCPASEILFKPKVDERHYNSGNIFQQQVKDFWNNEFWQALRKTNVLKGRVEKIPECFCCGNSINWWGSKEEKAHILDWSVVS